MKVRISFEGQHGGKAGTEETRDQAHLGVMETMTVPFACTGGAVRGEKLANHNLPVLSQPLSRSDL